MEIKVNIPRNDYKQLSEPRTEVVQAICDAFLNRLGFFYHPYNDGCYRQASTAVAIDSQGKGFCFLNWREYENKKATEYVVFYGCEMKAAFKALIKAGYHMFRAYEYRSWMGYICSKKPFVRGGEEVQSFNDFID